MAESVREVFDKKLPPVKNEKSFSMECAVCLQTCIHPAELPCGHIFCYLCIKGIVNQGRRCAMCRRDIPVDYLEKPRLINPVDVENSNQGFEDGHLWFYEGHNGWWQYDERTSLELESAYQKGERCCELLIAGFLYIADFDEMLQYRRNDPSRRRRIKRDLATTSKKGVAGLKTTKFTTSTSSNSTTRVVNEITHGQSSNVPETINSSPVAPVFPNLLTRPVYTQRARGRTLLGLSHSTCSTTTSQNTSSNPDNLTEYSRNFDFDNVIHETLDWTIEQIESLNLELLNDYEDLFRDVNNYGQLHGNLNQSRSGRVVDNFMNRFLSRRNQLRESSEDEPIALNRIHHASEFSNENNIEPPPVPPHEIPSTSETDLNESVVLTDSDTPPEPPLRGTSRRRNLRRSKSLNHEMCNSKIS